ncbi:unnamed protein product, partial [Prorocentrum cordatum]
GESARAEEPEMFSCLEPALSHMRLAPIEMASLSKDAVVKSALVIYLHGGKSTFAATMVDSAGGEVMQALMCLHTVGGATADTSVPGQMDMFAKSKYSPPLKFWNPVIVDHKKPPAEHAINLDATPQCLADVHAIERALPPSEVAPCDAWLKGVADAHLATATQLLSQGLAAPVQPDQAEAVVKLALEVFGANANLRNPLATVRAAKPESHGHALLGNFAQGIGAYNAESKRLQRVAAIFGMLEGPRELAAKAAIDRIRGFTEAALDAILEKRGTWRTCRSNSDVETAWMWINCAPPWVPSVFWGRFASSLLDKTRIYHALARLYRDLFGGADVLKDHLADVPPHAASAILGSLDQAPNGKNADMGAEAKLIDDLFIEGFEPAAIELKAMLFDQ